MKKQLAFLLALLAAACVFVGCEPRKPAEATNKNKTADNTKLEEAQPPQWQAPAPQPETEEPAAGEGQLSRPAHQYTAEEVESKSFFIIPIEGTGNTLRGVPCPDPDYIYNTDLVLEITKTGEYRCLDSVIQYGTAFDQDKKGVIVNSIDNMKMYSTETGEAMEMPFQFNYGEKNQEGQPEYFTLGVAYDSQRQQYLVASRKNTYGQWSEDKLQVMLTVFDSQGSPIVGAQPTQLYVDAFYKNICVLVDIVPNPDGTVTLQDQICSQEATVEINR